MNKDRISAFTLKIASSNKSELISVLYEIFQEYQADALKAFKEKDKDAAVEATKKCIEVVNHLQKDLNFEYAVSKNLYALYDYVQRCLSKSIYKCNDEGLLEAKRIMDSLGEAFRGVAEQDSSEPVMKNTQKVVAGMTYGRSSLNENFMGEQTSRGFWA